MRVNKIEKIALSLMVFIFILGNVLVVNAATGSIDLKLSSNKVNKGDKFTVTISASSDLDISWLEANLTYDTNKLELVSAGAASDKWSNMNSGDNSKVNIMTLYVDGYNYKSADIYVAEFKVKDSAQDGSTATITFSNIALRVGDAFEEVSLGEKTATVTINNSIKPSGGNTTSGNTTSGNTTSGNTTSGNTTSGNTTSGNTTRGSTTSGNTTSGNTTSGNTSTGNATKGSGKEVVVYSPDNKNTTKSKSGKGLPYTGTEVLVPVGIVVAGLAVGGLYFVNRRYRGL